MKICFSANSGGHLNEILQLKSFYKDYEYFFVTNKNAFSVELAKNEKVYFVEKFIIKEVFSKIQLIKPLKNVIQSLFIFLKEKPDIVITPGAGTAFGMWLFGKLFKKSIYIESIARIDKPSIFGKYIGKRSDLIIVQWQKLLNYYKNGVYGGIIFNFKNFKNQIYPSKIKKIFITTGTYELQFNRLFSEIDRLIENEKLPYTFTGQIGSTEYKPKYYPYFDYCGQAELHKNINDADLVICQGGAGSIMDSLMRGKRVIAVPRLPEFYEFVDNHQIELVGELERMGLIIPVYDIALLGSAINNAEKFNPSFNNLSESKYDTILKTYIDNIK
jgi:UDP-N-acetylglucosamine transferase subunit ALG13